MCMLLYSMSRRCYFVDWSNDDAGRPGWAGWLAGDLSTRDGQPRKKSTIVKGH
jgi:hypothetical protein